MQRVTHLTHHAQPVLLVVLPGRRVLLIARRELRHAESRVDVLEALAQQVQAAPKLRGLALDGGTVAVEFFGQPLDEHGFGILDVILRKLVPGVGLGLLHPRDGIVGVQRKTLVITRVVDAALLVRQRPVEQPAVRLQRFADLVFKSLFGVDGRSVHAGESPR